MDEEGEGLKVKRRGWGIKGVHSNENARVTRRASSKMLDMNSFDSHSWDAVSVGKY